MKICSKCQLKKPESAFYVRSKDTGRLHAQCKACYAEQRQINYALHYEKYKESYQSRALRYRTKVRTEFRNNIMAYLADKSCAICSESDIRTLEFDHIDPAQKAFGIAQSVRLGKKWPEVLLEIEKCQILCANCHKKRTAKQFNWYKI